MARTARGAAGDDPGGPLSLRLVATLLVLLASPAGWAGGPPAGQPGPAACRPIADDQSRLRCYDEAVDTAYAAHSPATAISSAGALEGESLFGKPPEESRALASRQLGLDDPATLDATVTQTLRNAAGKLVITLQNGQVWTQLDTTNLKLEAGEPVSIRKAALGSYLLQKQSGGRSLRVRRTQ